MQTPNSEFDLNFFPDSLIPTVPVSHASEPSSTSTSEHDSDVSQVRTRSNRVSTRPQYLDDYICAQSSTLSHTSALYSIDSFLDYSHNSPQHKAFIASISSSHEPSRYSQAVKEPEGYGR